MIISGKVNYRPEMNSKNKRILFIDFLVKG